jgi:hypothetical protein
MEIRQHHAQVTRRSFWLIAGWTVAIIAFWCCIYVGIADLEAQYKLEDRV